MEQLCELLWKVDALSSRTPFCGNNRIQRTRGIVLTNKCVRSPLCYFCNYPHTDLISTSVDEAVDVAKSLVENGIDRITLVAGWQGYNYNGGVAYVKAIRKEYPDLRLNAALGPLSKECLANLYSAGLDQYGCNLESTPPILVSIKGTDDFEERVQTLLNAKEVGLETSTGYIIGVGETDNDLSYLFDRMDGLGVSSIFMSPFVPYEGTHMASWHRPSIKTVLREVAMTRLRFNDMPLGFRIFRNGGFYPPMVIALAVYAGATFLAPPTSDIPGTYDEVRALLRSYSPGMDINAGDCVSLMSDPEIQEVRMLLDLIQSDPKLLEER